MAMIISKPGLLPSAISGPQSVLMSMVAVTNNSQEDRAAQNWPQLPLAATLERTGLPLLLQHSREQVGPEPTQGSTVDLILLMGGCTGEPALRVLRWERWSYPSSLRYGVMGKGEMPSPKPCP